mmetsp:Transcript_959/g.1571  ORF Transcript_959/g.1571 Transcript_959/m.1571 type:complete len:331 (-) Transcript_959:127-1119(-)|eukprot:CAMPEP_0119008372 /NCGR_PEP_ID=MMETSP1176-20130426/3644_1 /TAXON_ID=265551 /ORGANISM="Synedropsis recta cf, Strain CCMP1620" /LENGTH=330 /DNA_ID=CAMNT_0006960687 /DNA_START=134 /DNA_END=1126 /DNA_ORIENTATION=+
MGDNKPLSVVSALLGNCFCEFPNVRENSNPGVQFMELHGVEYIGLGAVASELTAEQRVRDTVAQLTEQTKRLISVGYLVDTRVTNTIPLDVWEKQYPEDRAMKRPIQKIINHIKNKEFDAALNDLYKEYEAQKKHPNRGSNKYLAGITGHNIAVLYVLSDQSEMALPLFRQAMALKRAAFGEDHPEVAETLDEIGIQLFAKKDIEGALISFMEAQKIRSKQLGSTHPTISMVLNNIGCCRFVQGNHKQALMTFSEARDVQQKSAQGDLDLLHVAITVNNLGYLMIQMRRYEEAQELFEEALLIQQSVLEDGHHAIQDTLSNLQFTNAFHC